MGRAARVLLRCLGVLCVLVGLWPCPSRSHPHDSGWTLGFPFSPLFRSYVQRIEMPPRTVENGTVKSSWFSSTVYGWKIRVFSWSMALVVAGASLVVASSLRRRSTETRP